MKRVFVGVVIAVAAATAMACGSVGTTTARTRATRSAGASLSPGSAPEWLEQFVDGTLGGSVFIPVGDGALVYGGVESDGSINRRGALLGRNGTSSEFVTTLGLVDATGVATDDAVYLAGRTCAGRSEQSDYGVACSPGRITVLRVDRETRAVSDVDLGVDLADTSGRAAFASIAAFGDGIVADLTGPERHTLIAIGRDGKRTPLPLPKGDFLCSVGTVLFAEAGPRAPQPEHEVLTDDAPGEHTRPDLIELKSGATEWTPVPKSPGEHFGEIGCSSGHLFELPGTAGDQSVAVFDPLSRRWVLTPDLSPNGLAYSLVNPITAGFVVARDQSYTVVDPDTGKLQSLSHPNDPATAVPNRVLADDLRLLSVGKDLTLEEIR